MAAPALSTSPGRRPELPGAPGARPPLSPQDEARRVALVGMKRLALGLLLLMAVVFAVSFALQERYPWLEYVRAAAEGGMVGAIADWFAVTALFRYPLGLRIPHTNIIANRKDEIGESLGEFVESNFLSDDVVRGKLESIGISHRLGGWLGQPENARRLTDEVSVAGTGLLNLLSDDDIKDLLEGVAREHLLAPQWGPSLGRLGEHLVASGRHHAAVDLLLEKAQSWLSDHPEAFGQSVSTRLPKWMPGFVEKMVDDKAYREVVAFVATVQAEPHHPLREAVDHYLAEVMSDLQHDDGMIDRVEALKLELVDNAKLREFASDAWESLKESLLVALADPDSSLRAGLQSTVLDVGVRLATDTSLGARIDRWLADTAGYVLQRYRHSIAGVITETVERWDPAETTEKIELQVGKDLQFIRINGTVVGALAGLLIYTVAQAALFLLG
jgi:uncharacterized membrane-anchored protein YjiN (DUF445 family)